MAMKLWPWQRTPVRSEQDRPGASLHRGRAISSSSLARELHRLVQRGVQLRARCIGPGNAQVFQVEDWLDESAGFLLEHFDPIHLQEAPGGLYAKSGGEGPDALRQRLIESLDARCAQLARLASEVLSRPDHRSRG